MGDTVSECCGAEIWASLGDGVLLGWCSECREMVCRMNTRTGAMEWLDGSSPWSDRDDLRKVWNMKGEDDG